MKKIVVAGGSGFIGEALVRHLLARGEEVAVLTRNPSKVKAGRGVLWNPPAEGNWIDEVASADVVINLAGENIGWNNYPDDVATATIQRQFMASADHRATHRSRARSPATQ